MYKTAIFILTIVIGLHVTSLAIREYVETELQWQLFIFLLMGVALLQSFIIFGIAIKKGQKFFWLSVVNLLLSLWFLAEYVLQIIIL